MNKNKTSGYVMAGVGFMMIVINALDYILGWETIHPAFGVVGLVFVAVGLKTARK